jgi:Flp pilus assembly protein CpaB
VLQDVTVLAVGTALAKPDADSSAAAIAAGTTSNGVKTVTVAVSPQDAAVLAAAQQSPSGGNVSTPLWLALRPFGEHGAAPNVESCGISPAPGA